MTIDADHVRRLFAHLESGAGDEFFAHVAEDVDWTVMAPIRWPAATARSRNSMPTPLRG